MQERYARNIPALTEEECKLLQTKRVCVVGCGGLGGYIIEFLARIGVGFIRAVDGDVFEESNLNRQILSSSGSLGVSKAESACKRIAEINPDVQAEVKNVFMTADNAEELIAGCDAVFDALDSIDARRILSKACINAGVPYVYGAIGGWVAQAAISMPEDDLISLLYPEGTQIKNKSVLGFTCALCASIQVSLGVKLLTGRSVDTGKIYYFDILNLEYETIDMA